VCFGSFFAHRNARLAIEQEGFGNQTASHLWMPLTNALSVDVEDYFQTEAMTAVAPRDRWSSFPSHVEANTRALYELFAQYKVCATFFFVGWVAERFPGLVRQACELGHEVGCHSYWHRPVSALDPEEFREDTYRAKSVIESAAGAAVRGYRAPSFSISSAASWAYGILEGLGFQYDSSLNPVRHPFYGNHSAPRGPFRVCGNLLELPIATWRVLGQNIPVGGGAYLRIFPYQLMKSGISSINQCEGRPAVLYLHPWEIDNTQPRLPARLTSRLRQYTGLTRMKAKLEHLLQQFRLGTVYDSVYLPAAEQMNRLEYANAE
jgi:polysaccharide deacetylase family protein (PEP-CTERM system associated)